MGFFNSVIFLVGATCTLGMVLESGSRLNDDGQSLVLNRAVREASTCSSAYSAVSESTMCLTDSPDYIPGTEGISADDKDLILQIHNDYRAGVYPTAKAMPKLYWDDELAILAEKWAKQCYVGHEEYEGYSRFMPGYGMAPGQNGGFGYASWEETIDAWHDEVKDFTFGQKAAKDKVVGHYTQIVQDKTVLIGCGYAKCWSGYQDFYICNYLKAQTSMVTPYLNGRTCEGCKGSCNEKLCDCSGHFCFNNGHLDLATCQCSCPSPFVGKSCLEKSCTVTDATWCGTAWPVSYCDMFGNVPGICPRMCGLC